ncbi:MAG: 3-oxoacyl-ACP synthase [Gammaproteobacteria bacterium]|nr:MAG: 3-oxoacyl-ACP synthase [Gammaproteobacteria bacterium]RLA12713.1 MAG: 3-oxoacyl-ACP synthase [Gammaproteobacteria bacterium]RLA16671.1 MAG: 3-oxoacyl-ACP synthase [Gammaproteobacteria bacterium]
MSSSSLIIKGWSAWMPGIHALEEWKAWAAGHAIPQAGSRPDVSGIPPMLRRRLSSLGKMALSVAFPLLEDVDTDIPYVFSSRHGELERTVGLLKSLAGQEPLSPTQFSLSVHNAIAGVMSIATKNPSSITALSADLSTTLLEAVAIMDEQSSQHLLCVVYDEPVPEIYAGQEGSPRHPFAIAFLVAPAPSSTETGPRQGNDLHLTFSICKNPDTPTAADTMAISTTADGPPPLAFLKFLLSPTVKELTLSGKRHGWHWTKPGMAANANRAQ